MNKLILTAAIVTALTSGCSHENKYAAEIAANNEENADFIAERDFSNLSPQAKREVESRLLKEGRTLKAAAPTASYNINLIKWEKLDGPAISFGIPNLPNLILPESPTLELGNRSCAGKVQGFLQPYSTAYYLEGKRYAKMASDLRDQVAAETLPSDQVLGGVNLTMSERNPELWNETLSVSMTANQLSGAGVRVNRMIRELKSTCDASLRRN